ncbi:unnamed protein product [Arctogadus glacialis]
MASGSARSSGSPDASHSQYVEEEEEEDARTPPPPHTTPTSIDTRRARTELGGGVVTGRIITPFAVVNVSCVV